MQALASNLTINIHVAQASRLTAAWTADSPPQPYARAYYVLDGTARLQHHDRSFAMQPSWLYLIPRHTRLVYRCRDFLCLRWCHFNIQLRGGIDLLEYAGCRFAWPAPDPDRTAAQFAALIETAAGPTLQEQVAARAVLLDLIVPLLADPDGERDTHRQQDLLRLQPVLAYIDAHLTEPLAVADLARCANLETTYFSSFFAKALGTPPKRYIHQRRIERALPLLWETNQTLDRIATDLGYTDAFHFSRMFKKLTGLPPSHVRHRQNAQP